jgi:hypothetical protein
MMASFYGGKLSQDRISYEIFKGGPPEGDLGYGEGFTVDPLFSRDDLTTALSWALGGVPVTWQYDAPTFEQIKTWIDAGQPIIQLIPGHVRVIDGYNPTDEAVGVTFHVLDSSIGETWASYNIFFDTLAVFVGPPGAGGAPNVKSDEDVDYDGILDTMDDSDRDGVVDFDEWYRFLLNPSNPDTDGDLVRDKAEIREYVFNTRGVHNWRDPDPDEDGQRKERDPDNDYPDNDGTIDGCEDSSNQNGIYEPQAGENDNFNPSDDKTLHLQLNWPKLGSAGDVFYSNRNPDWNIPGQCGNPTLDQDCTSGCTVENIRLDKLENGDYTIKVHYYSDHGHDDTSPWVTLRLEDKEYNFGPRQLSNGQIWNVATIRWPAKTVTQGSLVTDQALEELPLKPEE